MTFREGFARSSWCYNGLPDDDEVRLAVIASSGLQSNTGCRDAAPDTGAADAASDTGAPVEIQPRWDGCDDWSYLPDTPIINGVPNLTSKGYVRGGVLVVHSAALELDLGVIDFRMNDAVATATIVPRDGGAGFALVDAVVTGRSLASDLVATSARSSTNHAHLCDDKNKALMEVVRRQLCDGRDLPLRAVDDGRGKKCEALSVAVGFEALPAKLGSPGDVIDATACAEFDAACF